MELYRDFKELLELFNAQKVDIIVGGYALAFNGAQSKKFRGRVGQNQTRKV